MRLLNTLRLFCVMAAFSSCVLCAQDLERNDVIGYPRVMAKDQNGAWQLVYENPDVFGIRRAIFRNGATGCECCCQCFDYEGVTTESEDRKAWTFIDALADLPPTGTDSITNPPAEYIGDVYEFGDINYAAIGEPLNDQKVCLDCNDDMLFYLVIPDVVMTCMRQLTVGLWLEANADFSIDVKAWNFETLAWDVLGSISGPTTPGEIEKYEIAFYIEDDFPYFDENGGIYIMIDPACSAECWQWCLDYMRLCFQACRDGLSAERRSLGTRGERSDAIMSEVRKIDNKYKAQIAQIICDQKSLIQEFELLKKQL